jgi:hypothetical protein
MCMTNAFHLYIVVVIKMADPQDEYDHNEAMMNIINAGNQYDAPTRMRPTKSSMHT